MTTCQNCGEDSECNELCAACGHLVDACGEVECGTCVEQYTIYDDKQLEMSDEEIVECLLCEGPCSGMCELAQIERELAAHTHLGKARRKRT